MTTPTEPDWLDELFDDVRNACTDCQHPRCLGRKMSAKAAINRHIDEAVREAREEGMQLAIDKAGEIDLTLGQSLYFALQEQGGEG